MFKKSLGKILSDNRGYGIAEMLMVASMICILCGIVIAHLAPALGELHDNVRETISGIAGGGEN